MRHRYLVIYIYIWLAMVTPHSEWDYFRWGWRMGRKKYFWACINTLEKLCKKKMVYSCAQKLALHPLWATGSESGEWSAWNERSACETKGVNAEQMVNRYVKGKNRKLLIITKGSNGVTEWVVNQNFGENKFVSDWASGGDGENVAKDVRQPSENKHK